MLAHHGDLSDIDSITQEGNQALRAVDSALACFGVRPKLTAEQARAILREYPDADLSAFDVEGDIEAMAVEETAKSIAKFAAKADGCRCLCHTVGYPHIGPSAADPCCATGRYAVGKEG